MSTTLFTTMFTSIADGEFRDNTQGYWLEGSYSVLQDANGEKMLSQTFQLHTPKPTVGYYYMIWGQVEPKDVSLGWACTQEYQSQELKQPAAEGNTYIIGYIDMPDSENLSNATGNFNDFLTDYAMTPEDNIWTVDYGKSMIKSVDLEGLVICTNGRPFSNLKADGTTYPGTIVLKDTGAIPVYTGYRVFGKNGQGQMAQGAAETPFELILEESGAMVPLASAMTALYLAI